MDVCLHFAFKPFLYITFYHFIIEYSFRDCVPAIEEVSETFILRKRGKELENHNFMKVQLIELLSER